MTEQKPKKPWVIPCLGEPAWDAKAGEKFWTRAVIEKSKRGKK